MGLHRNRSNPREEELWKLAFQTDRFMSLMLQKPYAISNAQCKIFYASNGQVSNTPHLDLMMRLAVLIGKVLDITETTQEPMYISVLAIDQELNQLWSEMFLELWESNSFQLRDPGEAKFKSVKQQFGSLVILKARLILHLPYLLKFPGDPGLEYSQTSCINAARGIIQLFTGYRKPEFAGKNNTKTSSPVDLLGFLATAALVILQIGDSSSYENVKQFGEDCNRIDEVLEVFKEMSTTIGNQYCSILIDLIQLRHQSARGEELPRKVSIPFIGVVEFARRKIFIHQQDYMAHAGSISTSDFSLGSIVSSDTKFWNSFSDQSFDPPEPLGMTNFKPSNSGELRFAAESIPCSSPLSQHWQNIESRGLFQVFSGVSEI